MYGIMSKTAKVITIAGLALGISAIALPAEAGDRHGNRGGHGSYGKSYGYHGGYKHKRGYRKHAYKKGYRKGYRRGYAKGRKQAYKHGRRYNHSYWRKHGHHGVTVYGWTSRSHRSGYGRHRVGGACHPVVGKGRDHFGRRAKFGGTMCYDAYGRGYVVAGSRYVIRYF